MIIKIDGPGNWHGYERITRILLGDGITSMSMIDLCSHEATLTKRLEFARKTYVDLLPAYQPPPEHRSVAADVLGEHPVFEERYDVAMCFDGIEHLTRAGGLKLIERMKTLSDRQVLFTPLGDYLIQDLPDNPMAHKSGWLPENFDGFAAVVWPDFHPSLGIGAFWVWRADNLERDFNRVQRALTRRPTLATYTYVKDCVKIDYPFIESIQSALLIADRVFVCDAYSTDGTWEQLQALAASDTRIELMRHPWGDHYSVQGRICNGMLERITSEGYDFALQIQADEVVCEWTVSTFREELLNLHAGYIGLGRPRYVHLCPDYRTEFPFIYERKAVLSRCSHQLRYDADSDGCAITGGEAADLTLELHHVGKVQVGREKQALAKEIEFQKLYTSVGFPDPRFLAMAENGGVVDYRSAFRTAAFKPYRGPWPAVLLPRIARAEGRMA